MSRQGSHAGHQSWASCIKDMLRSLGMTDVVSSIEAWAAGQGIPGGGRKGVPEIDEDVVMLC